MSLKRVTENPTIADTLLFDIATPGFDGCFAADPYKVDTVKVYYVHRDTANGTPGDYKIKREDESLKAELALAKKAACVGTPTVSQLENIARLEERISASATEESLYFTQAVAVATFGEGSTFPAWLSTDTENALLKHIEEDEDGNIQYGRFTLEWNPKGMREGDYFICWSWTPNPSGDKLSNTMHFSLDADEQLTSSIPSHFTKESKYITLLERYTPELFKMRMMPNDLSPKVIRGLNGSVARGFTFLENMANQIVDLQDANSTHESLLQLLGNNFGMTLRSGDPTLWRRQVKRAVPLFKKKGTLGGLSEALAQSGIKLNKLTRLWQVKSKRFHQEAFEITEDSGVEFELAKEHVGDEATIYIRRSDEQEWSEVEDDSKYEIDGQSFVWLDDTIEVGDWVRVNYQTSEFADSADETLERYILSLDLADDRDERHQTYPLKNWNTRLLPEDDALFDDIIKTRHPFHDPVIWGWVRTEFPYSENIYNMEEYNGSSRESTSPCDIDRDFVDPCVNGVSSKFTLDLEIENLSSDRISEAQEIVKEYTPFHSSLHSINLFGSLNEFVQPPVEEINALIRFNHEEITVANAQNVFNRSMRKATANQDTFDYDGSSFQFTLSERPDLPADEEFVVELNRANESNWQEISLDNVELTATAAGSSTAPGYLNWIGHQLASPFLLGIGDKIRITYRVLPLLVARDADANPDMEALTQKTILPGYTNVSGTIKNNRIVLFSPDHSLSSIGVDEDEDYTLLEVLAPSDSAGSYKISNASNHYATVDKSDPNDDAGFTFRLSNEVIRATSNAAVFQDDQFIFTVPEVLWSEYQIKTQWDVDNEAGYSGGPWRLTLPTGTYDILDMLPDNSLVLLDDGTLPATTASNLSYTLKTDTNVTVKTGNTGKRTVIRRGRLDLSGINVLVRGSLKAMASMTSLSGHLCHSNYYVLHGGSQYRVEFVPGEPHQLYMYGYTGGNASGITAVVYQRLLDNAMGYFQYEGTTLISSTNLESALTLLDENGEITDDQAANNLKYNYLLLVPTDSGPGYYAISDIQGTTIVLAGPKYDWTLGGTSINFGVVKFSKINAAINSQGYPPVSGHKFNFLDRSGKAIFHIQTEEPETPPALMAAALNRSKKDQVSEVVSQSESISFEIETREVNEEQ